MKLHSLVDRYHRLSLRGKFALHAAVSIVVLFGILIPGVVYLQTRAALEQAKQRGLQLTKVFAHSSVQALVADDFLVMRQIINSIASERDVLYVMILDPSGGVLAHHQIREVGKTYEDPLSRRAADARGPLISDIGDAHRPGYDFAVPIYVMNEPRAVARIGISLERELTAIRETRNTIVGLGILALGAGLGWAAWQARRVTRPVSELVRGAQEITRGNLAHRIDISGVDELGQLALAFNHMTESVQALLETSRQLSSNLDPDAVLRSVAGYALGLVKADIAAIAPWDRATPEARIRVVLGARTARLGQLSVTPGRGLGGAVLATGAPRTSADYLRDPGIRHDPLYDEVLREEGVLSTVAVPITLRGDIVGVLWVANRSTKTFSDEDVDALGRMAHQAAIAMENARLYSETRLKTARLESLLRVSQAITATLDPERIVPVVLKAMSDLMDDIVVRLWAARESDGALALLGSAGLRVTGDDGELTIGPGESLVGAVAASRRPLAVDDLRSDRRLVRPEFVEREGLVSFLGLPLLREDKMLGVLAVVTRTPHRFTDDDVALFASFAQQAAIALENARLYHDLKRSHEELLAAQEQLVQKASMAAVGEIAAAVAHEARNPLGALSNCVQLLRRNPHITGEDAELLEIVHTESQRFNEIISEFLTFGRPRPPHLEDVDVHQVIEATLALLRRDGRCPSAIAFTAKFDPALVSLRADRDQLRQVFWNLFLNAVQAMGKEGELRVETRSDGTSAEISVEDTGSGIPAAARARIFEPFYTTRAAGTGLGLAIVRRIVEEHGGQIRVETEPGLGTCFTLSLPVDSRGA